MIDAGRSAQRMTGATRAGGGLREALCRVESRTVGALLLTWNPPMRALMTPWRALVTSGADLDTLADVLDRVDGSATRPVAGPQGTHPPPVPVVARSGFRLVPPTVAEPRPYQRAATLVVRRSPRLRAKPVPEAGRTAEHRSGFAPGSVGGKSLNTVDPRTGVAAGTARRSAAAIGADTHVTSDLARQMAPLRPARTGQRVLRTQSASPNAVGGVARPHDRVDRLPAGRSRQFASGATVSSGDHSGPAFPSDDQADDDHHHGTRIDARPDFPRAASLGGLAELVERWEGPNITAHRNDPSVTPPQLMRGTRDLWPASPSNELAVDLADGLAEALDDLLRREAEQHGLDGGWQ